MRRGLDYTTEKAARRFLGLVAEISPEFRIYFRLDPCPRPARSPR